MLADAINAPNVVDVMNADRTRLVTELMTIPTDRPAPSDHSELVFAQQNNNSPMAVMDWYYPGRLTGHELLYSTRVEQRLSEDPQIAVMASNAPQIYG